MAEKQQEMTSKQLADTFYKALGESSEKGAKYRKFASELKASHPNGLDDRELARAFLGRYEAPGVKITDLDKTATPPATATQPDSPVKTALPPAAATTTPESQAKADVAKLKGDVTSGATKPLLGFAEPYVKKAEEAARSMPKWDFSKNEHSIGQLLGATAQVSTGVMGGLAEAGIQLSSPANIGMMVAGLGTKWIKRAPKLIRALRLAASGALTAETAKDLVEEFPQAMDALQSGDAVGFGRAVGKGFADIMLGKEAGKEALSGTKKLGKGVAGAGKGVAEKVKGVKDYLASEKPTAPPPAARPAAAPTPAPTAPAAAPAPQAPVKPAVISQKPVAPQPAAPPASSNVGQAPARPTVEQPTPVATKPAPQPVVATPKPSNVGQQTPPKPAIQKPAPAVPTPKPAPAVPAKPTAAAPAAGGELGQKIQAIIKERADIVSGDMKDPHSRLRLKQLDQQLTPLVEQMKSGMPPEKTPRAGSQPAPTTPPQKSTPQGQQAEIAPVPPKIVPAENLHPGNTYHVIDTDPELGLYKGEQLVYRGTSRGKHSFTAIDPETGTRTPMEIDDSAPQSQLLKVLGEPESRIGVKVGPRTKGRERGSFPLRGKTKAQKLAAAIEGPKTERTSQTTREGRGSWISPEGEVTDLGEHGMHQDIAARHTGKKNAKAAVEGMMGEGWVRVRGGNVEAAETAAESPGFLTAVHQAAENAQGSPIHVQLGGRHVFLDQASVGDFSANPLAYMRRMMAPPPATR